MTSDSLNGPVVWTASLATAIALAVRSIENGTSGTARTDLLRELEKFLAEANPTDELADTLAEIARLPRIQRGT